MSKQILSFVATAAVLLCQQAHAYNEDGHEVAATVAYTDDSRQAVIEAEQNNTRTERVHLTSQYFRDVGRINRERAVMAAFRLAMILESTVDAHE